MKLANNPIDRLPQNQVAPAGSWSLAKSDGADSSNIPSTQALVDQVHLQQDQLAVFHFDSPGRPQRLKSGAAGSLIGASLGLLVGQLTNSGTAVSAALGGLAGGVAGTLLAPRETLHKGVAGVLHPDLSFTPQNDPSHKLALSELENLSPSQQAEKMVPQVDPVGLSIDQIKQLPEYNWSIPTRDQQLQRLKDPAQEWDILVIGGGATGSGTTLEAARRGLKVACVESYDFSSGTSSKSTKLVHGGVRYLEKAVKNFDKEQYELVKEGLEERGVFLNMAPHLSDELRLVTPCYSKWEVPYYAAGLWLYDRIAGQAGMSATKILSARAAKEQFPMLKSDGLAGAVAYSDGQFNDSRMNVSLATTAAAHGAAVANYCEVVSLIKEDDKVVGAQLRDKRSGETFPVKSKVVINATGPFIDGIRKMDSPQAPDLVVPSAGTHIFVPGLKVPEGLLIPKAPNGSVAFFRPFEGGTIIGTTEEKSSITIEPTTTADQVEYLRNLANSYLGPQNQIQPDDVKSVWTGIRPLVKDPSKASDGKTVELVRNHLIDVSGSGLVTIGGGKWTSFGRMAQDTVDQALQTAGLPNMPTQRQEAKVIGAHGYSQSLAPLLADKFSLSEEVAQHLAHSYGDRSIAVAELAASNPQLAQKLHPDYPYLGAEIIYSMRSEYATNPVDVLSRRTRLSFIDEEATAQVLPKVVGLMAAEAGWNALQTAQELKSAEEFYARNGKAALG